MVLGGTGFIGSALARRLKGSVLTPSHSEADLTDPASLARVIRPGDVIVNAAGYAAATDRTRAGARRFQAINVEGVRNLAQVAVNAGASGLIQISSVAAMGRWTGAGISEGMMRPPRSRYAQSKLDGERALEAFRGRLPFTILRPTSVFGEGRGLAAALCRLATLPISPLPSGGQALVPFSYVGNLAHAVELAMRCEACRGRTFIVGDERSYMLREIVGELARALHRPARIVPVPTIALHAAGGLLGLQARLRGRSPLLEASRIATLTRSVSYSIAEFQAATDYRPVYSLADGATRIAHWYRASTARVIP